MCRIFTFPCDPLSDDCAEGRCGLSEEGTACLTEGGLVQEGESCMEDVDCAVGLACISLDNPCESTCEPLCDIYGELCPDNADGYRRICAWLGRGDLGVCIVEGHYVPECDPPCEDGQECVQDGNTAVCHTPGTLEEGEECGFSGHDCAEGLICAGLEDHFVCMRVCHPLSDPMGCLNDEICLRFYGMEDEDYGVCQRVIEECSPLCQTGCFDGEKCTYGPHGVECLPHGTVGLGEACGDGDDCRAGGICLGNEGEGYTCRALCEPELMTPGGSAACGEGEACLDLGSGLLAIGYCEPFPQACSILDQDCPSGQRCLVAHEPDGEGLYGTVCLPAGPRGLGESCDEANDCGAGFICLNMNGESRCYGLCDPIASEGCGSGEYCSYYAHPALGAPVGYCQPYGAGDCSLADQDCPEGETCDLGVDGNRCVEAGDLPLAAPCDPKGHDCAVGLTCYGANDVYQCLRVCEPGAQGCSGEECLSLPGLANINYGLCGGLALDACDIVEQDCPAGQTCGLGPAGTICLPVGEGALHDPCLDSCGAGLFCLGEPCRTCEILCMVANPTCPPEVPVCAGVGEVGVCVR